MPPPPLPPNLESRRPQMFPVLDARDMERMQRFGEIRRFRDGECLFAAGQPSPGMLVLAQGRVALSRRDGLGHSIPIVEEGPGQFLGEVAQLSGRPSLVDAHAVGEVEALVIPPHRLRALLVAEADLGERIMRALIQECSPSEMRARTPSSGLERRSERVRPWWRSCMPAWPPSPRTLRQAPSHPHVRHDEAIGRRPQHGARAMKKACPHLEDTQQHRTAPVHPSGHGCMECLKDGGDWVHLRMCLTCGHVGCCDDSPSRHATQHFHASAHPVIKSFEPGENWAWCYVDEQFLDRIPTFPGESPSVHYSAP